MNQEKKVVYEQSETVTVIDEQTGEIKSNKTQKYQNIRISKEPEFVKLYLDHLARFKNIQISLSPIFMEFLHYTTYANIGEIQGGMILIINKALKEIVATKCNVSRYRVDQAVTEFVKKGYMQRLALGMYQINPYLFGKGEWKDIANIRATFDYGTGEVVADIVKEEEQKMNKASDEIEKESTEKLTHTSVYTDVYHADEGGEQLEGQITMFGGVEMSAKTHTD